MERFLDVSELAAPEPLERVLDTLAELSGGKFLHVYHRRDPLLLYPLLEEGGWSYLATTDRDHMVHVFVWKQGDAAAAQEARREFDLCTGN